MPEESTEAVTVTRTAGTRKSAAARPGRAPADRKAKDTQRRTAKKATAAQKAEATDTAAAEAVTFDYHGETYGFDAAAFNDLDTFELIGDMITAEPENQGLYITPILKRVMGDQEWARLKRNNRDSRGRTDVAVLFEVWEIVDGLAGK